MFSKNQIVRSIELNIALETAMKNQKGIEALIRLARWLGFEHDLNHKRIKEMSKTLTRIYAYD